MIISSNVFERRIKVFFISWYQAFYDTFNGNFYTGNTNKMNNNFNIAVFGDIFIL